MRYLLEVGAQCGNAARWELRGGRWVTGVPTATKRMKADPGDGRALGSGTGEGFEWGEAVRTAWLDEGLEAP